MSRSSHEIPEGRPSTLLVVGLVLLNLLVKGWYLGANSLGGDEPFSVYHAQMNPVAIVQLLAEGNNPPLFELVLHYWIKLLGISEVAVRMPSLIFSCVTVIFLYKFGKKFIHQRVGIYAALLFIFFTYHIGFAHEARVYALLGMLSLLAMYYFLDLLTTPLRKNKELLQKLLLLLLFDSLLIYAHYFGFLILLVQFLFVVLQRQLRLSYWKICLLVAVVLGLVYLPNSLVLLNRFSASSGGTWVAPTNGIESLYNMLWIFSNAPVVAVLVIGLFVATLIKYLWKRPASTIAVRLLLFWFFFLLLGMFAVSFKIPMFMDRYLMPAAISFPLVVALCCDYLVEDSKLRYFAPGILIFLVAITSKPNLTNKRDVRTAVKEVQKLMNEQTVLYICPEWLDKNFLYYYDRTAFASANPNGSGEHLKHYYEKKHIFPIATRDELKEDDLEDAEQLIYFEDAADFHSPNNLIKTTLDDRYPLKRALHFEETINVYVYDLQP